MEYRPQLGIYDGEGLLMKNNESLRVACLTLINAIISSPDDLELRIHLRSELARNGLIEVIQVIELILNMNDK